MRTLALASATYNTEGFHPEVLAGIDTLKPEDLDGSLWQKAYARTAPNPDDWPTLIAKVKQLDKKIQD